MTNADGDLAIQLVDGDGKFNKKEMIKFAREVNLSQCGRSYAVVAIMGPQSSGKSTLLNNLFLTNFKEMNHLREISQTTKGIWLARSPNIKPLTLVMDMEGTDGAEREDNTAFEKQSALFALAVADVVLINMWCHDIGRNRAANLPLLSVVFEQVVNRFSNKARKITLMFVVRDKTASPEGLLEDNVKKNVNKIWTSIRKPPESSNMELSDFFKVEVVFLSNYQDKERNGFNHEIKKLQERFVNSTAPGGLVGDKKEPASGFSITAEHIWKEIKENKNLNLPSYQVMVATIRCEQIKNDKYYSFQNNEDWCKLCERVQFGFIRNFGKIVNSIINIYVSEYDKEAAYFDEAITNAMRKELVDKLLQQDVQPKYQAMLNHLRLKHFKEFMEAFDNFNSDEHDTFAKAADDCIKKRLAAFDKESEGIRIERAKWDNLKERAKLQREMKSYIATKRENKVASKIRRLFEPKLKQELSDSVRFLLCEETDPTWSNIRLRFKTVMKSTVFRLNKTFSEFGIDEEGRKEKIERIEEYAKDVVEAKAREEKGRAKQHMIRKFVKHFMYGSNSSPRDWQSHVEIERAAKAAISTPLDVLAGLAAIRLEADDADNIRQILFSAFLSGDPNTLYQLDSHSWAQVPSSRTLITPIQCKQLWQGYLIGVKNAVNKAVKDLERKSPGWLECVVRILTSIISFPFEVINWFAGKIF